MQTPEAAIQEYFNALNQSNLDGIVDVFDDDGSIMAQDFPTASGARGLRGFFEHMFKVRAFSRELHVDRIVDAGTLATVQSHTTGTVTALDTGASVELTSRELFVLRMVGDGWRIVDYMFNHAH